MPEAEKQAKRRLPMRRKAFSLIANRKAPSRGIMSAQLCMNLGKNVHIGTRCLPAKRSASGATEKRQQHNDDGATTARQRRDISTVAAQQQHGSGALAAKPKRGAQANPPVHALRHRTSPIGASRSDALGADSVSQRFRCPEANLYAFSGILHSRMKPTMNSMAMDSTPIEGLPVICVKNDTRNVPMIAAYFPKMSKKP